MREAEAEAEGKAVVNLRAEFVTIREASFVYPLLNTLRQTKGLSAARRLFYEGLAVKLKTIIDGLEAKKEEIIIRLGQRRGQLEKFRLVTPEQNEAAKAEIVLYKDGSANLLLSEGEAELFEILLTHALLGGYEDFPAI